MKENELIEDLRKRRENLFAHPTPLEKLKNLSSLTGVEIYMKREDLIGFGFGGNKIRKMEYLIVDVKHKGADTMLTWGGIQSNWCRAMSSVCRVYGIEPNLILFKRENLPEEMDGNFYLERLLGAKIRFVEGSGKKLVRMEDIKDVIEEEIFSLQKKGRRTYLAPIGASYPEGSMEVSWGGIAYLDCFFELMAQSADCNFEPDWIVLATGSGGTQAGLIVGSKLANSRTKVLGISVSEKKEEFKEMISNIVKNIENYIQVDLNLKDEEIIINDEYLGEGYGILTKEVARSLITIAEVDGVFLDPVYTGKAMHGMLDLIGKGFIKKGEKVVFIHTGGLPALFPYRGSIERFL